MTRQPAGRHFLQIPGPTNVPERILQAIAKATIDHRGPDFQRLGREVLDGLKAVFKTEGPVIVYPASGTGAWEAALVNTAVAGRPGPDVRDRAFRGAVARAGARSRPWHRNSSPATGAQGVDRGRHRGAAGPDRAHEIKAVCIVHNETSTGVTSKIGAIRRAIDRQGTRPC